MIRVQPVILLSVTAALAAGCSSSGTDVESETVATRSIWAGMDLTSRGNGNTRVKVELNENNDSGSNIRLSANERLEVNAGGIIVPLREDVDIADIDYEGTVPTDAANTVFQISLYRADGTINSGSSVTIAPPFDIVSPVRGQAFASGSRLPITWTPPDPSRNVELEVRVRCPANVGGTTSVQWFPIDDNGNRSFNTNNLNIVRNNSFPSGTVCDLDIALRRESRGRVDPAFRGGGFVRAIQVRRVEDMTLALP